MWKKLVPWALGIAIFGAILILGMMGVEIFTDAEPDKISALAVALVPCFAVIWGCGLTKKLWR